MDMKMTVRATAQPDSMDECKASFEKFYGVKASWDNRVCWTFEGPVENMELLIQDHMQLKPLS